MNTDEFGIIAIMQGMIASQEIHVARNAPWMQPNKMESLG